MSLEESIARFADQGFAIAFCILIYFDMRKKLDKLISLVEKSLI